VITAQEVHDAEALWDAAVKVVEEATPSEQGAPRRNVVNDVIQILELR
jgi:hypothetical protein